MKASIVGCGAKELAVVMACALVMFTGCGAESKGNPLAAARDTAADAAPAMGGDTASLGGSGGSSVVDTLWIEPATAALTATGTSPAFQSFRAFGRIGTTPTTPVAATFSVDNTAPGDIDPATGVYTTNNAAGGVVHVTATYHGKTATAVLTVSLNVGVSSGAVPAGAASLFDPSRHALVTGDAMHSPVLVYPVTETKFPQNLYHTLFNWRPAGNKLFLLKFESPVLSFQVYTDGIHPTCTQARTGGACWESDQKTWTSLAATNAGQSVTLTIYGMDPASPDKVYASNPSTFSFSKSPVPGALYYWSTTAKGVRRGALSDAAPSNFMTPAEANGKCIACHTLSRNGKRLAGDVGGEKLWVVDVVRTPPPPAIFTSYNGTSISSAWATFNADTTRVVSAKGGVLTLRDGVTGAPIGPNGGALPVGTGVKATMPDWAPDGRHVVYIKSTLTKDRSLTGSSIAWLNTSGDTFSSPEVLLTSLGSNDNYAYPMFSPTSDWLAFARGTTDTDNDPTSQIYIARAQAGTTRQQLVRADTLVNDDKVDTGLQNTMPTWAPTSADGTQWVAFTSTRDYGMILAHGSAFGDQKDQLWIAAIDTAMLGSEDPSFPAFRVPFLELTENCHRPFWAEDAFAAQPMPDAGASDAGTPDAGCVGSGQECTMATCCAGTSCLPAGDTYACVAPIR